MSNVVSLRRLGHGGGDPAVPALVDLLAVRRRHRHDPFWLKENAELAQILAATGCEDADLSPLRPFISTLMSELRFFPQYYRLYLSLAVDLAALGLPDVPLAPMADFVLAERLIDVELSDTHRGEARLLVQRAGSDPGADPAMDERLALFARNARGFCLPNRRAAYDLTHVVFHAADYGRRPIGRDADRRLSLIHAGMIAWLEDNLDLLAEVVIALSLSDEQVPDLWRRAVLRGASAAEFSPGHDGARFDDDYHQYLVANWAASVLGGAAFGQAIPRSARLIHQPKAASPALRELSLALLDLGRDRCGDWARMRWRIWGKLSEPSRARIKGLETMPEFEGFFEGFARADRTGEQGKC